MKNYKKGLKKFLLERKLIDYGESGTLELYHFSPTSASELTLDPERFLSGRSTFSKREYEKSQVPRTFFYVDVEQAEAIVKSGRKLYKTTVPSTLVYDLYEDRDGIKRKSVQPGAFFVDFNKVFDTIKENYKGVFYKLPSFDVVAWFDFITVERHEEEI